LLGVCLDSCLLLVLLTHIQYSLFIIQNCFKLLPYAGGVIAVLLLAFALWVRTVPPAEPKPKVVNATTTTTSATSPLDLSSIDPEALKQAGLTMEDLQRMTMEAQQEQQQQDGGATDADSNSAPPLEDEGEEISLDDNTAGGEERVEETIAVEEGAEEKTEL